MPVELDDSAILIQGGIDHSEGDPRLHQQMVYAVASRIVEIFDRARFVGLSPLRELSTKTFIAVLRSSQQVFLTGS